MRGLAAASSLLVMLRTVVAVLYCADSPMSSWPIRTLLVTTTSALGWSRVPQQILLKYQYPTGLAADLGSPPLRGLFLNYVCILEQATYSITSAILL